MKYIYYVIMTIFAVIIGLTMLICIFTPEKTKDGMYTDPIKYWTDDTYFHKNF